MTTTMTMTATTMTTTTTTTTTRESVERKGEGRDDEEDEEEEDERWKRNASTERRETWELVGVVCVYLASLLPIVLVKTAERNGIFLQQIPQVGATHSGLKRYEIDAFNS